VCFDIDANGILHVGAKDKGTGKENKITIKANSGLSEAEIQQMVKDAELNAAEDKKKLELVQARNQGEPLVHSVKKSLTEYGDKLDAGEKEKIEAADQGRRRSPQGRRQGRDRGQEQHADDRQPEAGREDVRRHAGQGGRSGQAAAGGDAAIRPSRPTTTWSTPK
jgi:molecular chaperone DnaK